ncbi:MAG TPA: thymidine kinase [Bacteroidia bacterium]|nr:thymidine kinase [Bacteroidia bacterium]HNU32222.1 thymidine kinase [Bacteroidia bacterium]
MSFDQNHKQRKGAIEVICGSMFSGKTEELIRRLKRARIARQKVEIFKPQIDQRYHETNIVSHDSNYIPSTPILTSSQILILSNDVEVIGIDEAQFFDNELPNVCEKLANMGMRVIVAGLDMDFLGKPFGPIPHLMAIADYVTKVHAVCMECGDLAHFSFRTVKDASLIVLGEKESYVPLCRSCYVRETEKLKVEKSSTNQTI